MYAAMTCNAHVTSNPTAFAQWLERTVEQNDLDLVALQELTPAHGREIRERMGDRFLLIQSRRFEGSESLGVLVRRSVRRSYSQCRRMGRKGWYGWRADKDHPPRSLTYVVLEDGTLFGSTHAPPGVDVSPGRVLGKADRKIAWVSFVRAFRRWGKRHKNFVVAADWNDPHSRRGRYSISWLAKKTGATPRGSGIDYVLAKGRRIELVQRIPGAPGTDHDALLFNVRN